MFFGNGIQHRTGLGQVTGRQRKPRNKADVVLGAVIKHLFAGTIHQVVLVLHRGDVEVFRGGFDIVDRHLAQSGMCDHAIVDQRFDRGKLLIARHFGIDAMQLPQVDAFHAKVAQAFVCLLDQILGAPDRCPLVGSRARQAAFRCNDQPLIRVQRFANQRFGHVRPIRVCRVDKVHTQFRQALQCANAFCTISRIAPNTFACNTHGAVTKAMNFELAADLE